MKVADVVKWIQQSNGRIFKIKFIKRSTNEEREMTCRTGVTAHLVDAPSKPGLHFEAHGLIPVFDMQKKGYRSIPTEGITAIWIEKEWRQVEHDRTGSEIAEAR